MPIMRPPSAKSLLPRSLFGRALMILLVPIVLLQLIVGLVFFQRHYQRVTEQMTRGVALEIRYAIDRIEAAPDDAAAQAALLDIGGPLQLSLALDPAATLDPVVRRRALDLTGRALVSTLETQLERPLAIDLAGDDRVVRIAAQTDKGLFAVEAPRSRLSVSNPHQLLVLMVITSVVMTGVAYVFLRNQLTPIARLAKAAEAFGKGQVVPYRPRGALEVRAAGNAFLDMRARIERAIESRTQMLSGVSHDLRTPLTRMKLALSLMPEDDDTEALMRDVAQMERMVDEFLAFARGDAMEDAVPVDPVALVQEIADEAARAGQPLRLGRLDWPGGTIRLRPHAVRRALDNLISNAVRHGTVAELSLAAGERMLRFSVEDDGPGIPRELREEAMQPFRRLDAARDPNKGGVGLGLAIAADVARSHGGVLRLLDSEALGGLRAELSVAR